MKLKELLDKANKGYPNGFLAKYYDRNGNPKLGQGDLLAKFIVSGIRETFVSKASDEDQYQEAIRVVLQARSWLVNVADALIDASHEAASQKE